MLRNETRGTPDSLRRLKLGYAASSACVRRSGSTEGGTPIVGPLPIDEDLEPLVGPPGASVADLVHDRHDDAGEHHGDAQHHGSADEHGRSLPRVKAPTAQYLEAPSGHQRADTERANATQQERRNIGQGALL